jgi:hypothetical protein
MDIKRTSQMTCSFDSLRAKGGGGSGSVFEGQNLSSLKKPVNSRTKNTSMT